jgi:hypothetical protein
MSIVRHVGYGVLCSAEAPGNEINALNTDQFQQKWLAVFLTAAPPPPPVQLGGYSILGGSTVQL